MLGGLSGGFGVALVTRDDPPSPFRDIDVMLGAVCGVALGLLAGGILLLLVLLVRALRPT
jgi:hypothetical protein